MLDRLVQLNLMCALMSITSLCKGLVWEWCWCLLEAKLALGDELSELLSLERLVGGMQRLQT